MNIELTLNCDFERTLNTLREKYSEDFEFINGLHRSQQNSSDFLANFVKNDTLADATIDPNANANHKDIRSFITEKGKSQDKLFALNKIFLEMKKKWGVRSAKKWFEEEFSKGFYLNDASSASYFPYCWANDLTRLATEGLFFLEGYNHKAPKHLTTFLDDAIEFVSFLSNRQSGAVGLPNIIIWAYYFWKKDCAEGFVIKSPDYYLRQCFQKLIFRLNQPFLRLDQAAFTNVSIFDQSYIESLFGGIIFPDGSLVVDQVEEIIECEKIFMEVVSSIRHEQMFTFPVLTYSLLKRSDLTKEEIGEMMKTHDYHLFVNNEFARWCSDHNWEWNDSNFFMSRDVTTLSNCCRLLSDTTKLQGFQNSIGGSALSIGSCRVSTINLMRIAYESKFNKKKYLEILKDKVVLNCKALYSMRSILKRNIEKGLLPNYRKGAVELEKQYCTIGILGMYEVMDSFNLIASDEFGYKLYTDEAMEFAKQIFDVINEVKDNFTTEFTYNVESIPGENSAGVLCHADNLLFENDKYFIYSNQWIPLTENCTIKEKCRVSSELDKLCSGGSIAHINIENRFPTKDAAWDALNFVASNEVIYSAFNIKINVCKNRHAFIGVDKCPVCNEPVVDQFTRVVGFFTPASCYQKIRKHEFNERKWYKEGLNS